MSADNGIYIVKTKSPTGDEYRVREMCAVNNLFDWTNEGRVNCKLLRDALGDCQVHSDYVSAKDSAAELLEEVERDGFDVEYGISLIELDVEFPHALQ